jgi:CRP-like cAMP-binding protein
MTTRQSSANHRALPATRNALLAALPPTECRLVLSKLLITPLRRNAVLYNRGEQIDRVYFPTEGFFSLVNVLHSGRMVEVATVGREGILGLAASVEGSTSPTLTVVQGESDSCYSLAADTFREELDRRGVFYMLIARYT